MPRGLGFRNIGIALAGMSAVACASLPSAPPAAPPAGALALPAVIVRVPISATGTSTYYLLTRDEFVGLGGNDAARTAALRSSAAAYGPHSVNDHARLLEDVEHYLFPVCTNGVSMATRTSARRDRDDLRPIVIRCP